MFSPSVVHAGKGSIQVSEHSLLFLVGFLSQNETHSVFPLEDHARAGLCMNVANDGSYVSLSRLELYWKQMSLLCEVISVFLLPITFPGLALVRKPLENDQ